LFDGYTLIIVGSFVNRYFKYWKYLYTFCESFIFFVFLFYHGHRFMDM